MLTITVFRAAKWVSSLSSESKIINIRKDALEQVARALELCEKCLIFSLPLPLSLSPPPFHTLPDAASKVSHARRPYRSACLVSRGPQPRCSIFPCTAKQHLAQAAYLQYPEISVRRSPMIVGLAMRPWPSSSKTRTSHPPPPSS
jgi:hypothetical protein